MPHLSSILLVDDDSTTNFLNQHLLRRMAVADELLVAENGAEALRLLAPPPQALGSPAPSLILLDVNMPVMNGIEFLQAWQQLPVARRQGTVVVVLTTSLHARDMQQVQQLPVTTVVDKPLTEAKVHAILDQYFQQHIPGI
ncbi:response regulator [Hymenobacter jeollabukensis]|uniref:Response regulator n=1 Tax=Hymenobacter jeollabukensis TaxID=2025313 RepID=A0A5R8WWH1_9BACT|nr:response regulator [Hymenobacter jeollabukensis]TLM96689.1 response regulator [Hymenobacter jeollabukensis]